MKRALLLIFLTISVATCILILPAVASADPLPVITKTVTTEFGPCPGTETLTIFQGEIVKFCYELVNAGTHHLYDVAVIDDNLTPGDPIDDFNVPLAGLTDLDGDTFNDDLAVGATASGISIRPFTSLGTFTNTATAYGEDAFDVPFFDTDSASVTIEGPKTISIYIAVPGFPYEFGPEVNATVIATSLLTPGTVTITVHPDEYYPGCNNSKCVKRWFNIDGGSASGTFTLTLRYKDGDLNGLSEANFCLWRNSGGWQESYVGTFDAGANSIEVSGVTAFSDWVISNDSMTPPVPEIATIILICTGIIALGGYLWYRRRKHILVKV